MRYRWDPAYPMSRRDTQLHDADLRVLSDDDSGRNAVADKLSRHYAEGRLDEAEFKNGRLDTAMSATKRGDLNGLFHDLPRAPSEPAPPPPRHRRVLPWVFLVAFLALAAGVVGTPWYPLDDAPWPLIAVVGFFVWRRAVVGHAHWHQAAAPTVAGRARSWTTEACAYREPLPPERRHGRPDRGAARHGALRGPARQRTRRVRGAGAPL